MKKLVTIGAILMVILLPLAAIAQEDQEKDVLEFGVFGGLSLPTGSVTSFSDSLGAKSGFNIGIDGGYFLTPNLTLGGSMVYHQLGIKKYSVTNNQHHRLYNPSVYLKYHFFGKSNFSPYVRADVGAAFVKFSTFVLDDGDRKYREIGYHPGLSAGAGVGAFYYTSDYSGFFVEAHLTEGFTKNVTWDFQGQKYTFGENITVVDLRAGIQVFFGSK